MSRNRFSSTLQEIIVNRLQLMRQRVYGADRQTEIAVELEGDAEGVGLEAEPQNVRVAIEGEGRGLDRKLP
jgi:hypothetical protein